MYLSKEERRELEALSKEVFGSTQRYRKFLDNGMPELVTRTIVETVPGENGAEPTTVEKVVEALTPNGVRQFVNKYHTVESMKEYMLKAKAQRDEMIAQIKKLQEEQRAKAEQEKLLKEVQSENSGSAV